MGGVRGQRSGGHAAKTVAAHLLAGTYRPTRHAGYSSPRSPQGTPNPPKHLRGEAKAEWTRMIGRLMAAGMLSLIDDAVLLNYCQSHALAHRLQEEVDALPSLTFVKVTVDGAGQEHQEYKAHPLVSQLRQARLAVRVYLVEFGMTPASRGRVKLPEGEHTKGDPFAEFDNTPASSAH